jgi:hypothetical protein
LRITPSECFAEVEYKPVGDLTPPDLAGLTFYSAEDIQSVRMNGHDVEVIQNPRDHTGRISYSIPLKPLEYCWG